MAAFSIVIGAENNFRFMFLFFQIENVTNYLLYEIVSLVMLFPFDVDPP